MKIANYNIPLRKTLTDICSEFEILLLNDLDKFNEEINEFYEKIKDNKEKYKYMMGLIYSSSYMVSKEELKLLSNTDCDDGECVKEKVDFLENIDNIDEFIESCEIEDFYDFLFYASLFDSKRFIDKKEIIYNSLDNKEHIKKVFPGFIYDELYYLNKYNAEEIVDEYNDMLYFNNGVDYTKYQIVLIKCESLNKIGKTDFNNYKFLLLEMIEIYYKYNKYLLSKNKEKYENTKFIIDLIETDINFLINISLKNENILKSIVADYLDYFLLNESEYKELTKFYEEPKKAKKYVKVLKKTLKLKEEN